jgi:hypothetical protein
LAPRNVEQKKIRFPTKLKPREDAVSRFEHDYDIVTVEGGHGGSGLMDRATSL